MSIADDAAPTNDVEPRTSELEAQQVERARTGDPLAFRWLFERDRRAVYRLFLDLVGEGDASREATQETFVRAHRQLSLLRDPTRWRPWLFGIARRVSLEHARKRRRAPLPIDPSSEQRATREPDPEAALIGRESERMIDRALAQLSDDRRAALTLCVDHHFEYGAIAEIMGWSLAKVKVEIHRARIILRAELKDYVEGRP
jgi:RNA polymerase sigma-70 factor (ECF subfamily)